jgi:hypothetical protein
MDTVNMIITTKSTDANTIALINFLNRPLTNINNLVPFYPDSEEDENVT